MEIAQFKKELSEHVKEKEILTEKVKFLKRTRDA